MEKKIMFVRKRDGRMAPFIQQKISEAIFKAAQSVGGQDKYLAEDLAEAVSLYIEQTFKGEIPSVEEIQDIVERVLIKTGHAKTAKSYILYREKRARVRKVREGLQPEQAFDFIKAGQYQAADIKILVRHRGGSISCWDKKVATGTLVREAGLSESISEIITGEVEEGLLAAKRTTVSTGMIRELIAAKLIEYGFDEERDRYSRIGISVCDMRLLLTSCGRHTRKMDYRLAGNLKEEFALATIVPSNIVRNLFNGALKLGNLEDIDRFIAMNAYISERTLLHVAQLSDIIKAAIPEVFKEGASARYLEEELLSGQVSPNGLPELWAPSARGHSTLILSPGRCNKDIFGYLSCFGGDFQELIIKREESGSIFELVSERVSVNLRHLGNMDCREMRSFFAGAQQFFSNKRELLNERFTQTECWEHFIERAYVVSEFILEDASDFSSLPYMLKDFLKSAEELSEAIRIVFEFKCGQAEPCVIDLCADILGCTNMITADIECRIAGKESNGV